MRIVVAGASGGIGQVCGLSLKRDLWPCGGTRRCRCSCFLMSVPVAVSSRAPICLALLTSVDGDGAG